MTLDILTKLRAHITLVNKQKGRPLTSAAVGHVQPGVASMVAASSAAVLKRGREGEMLGGFGEAPLKQPFHGVPLSRAAPGSGLVQNDSMVPRSIIMPTYDEVLRVEMRKVLMQVLAVFGICQLGILYTGHV